MSADYEGVPEQRPVPGVYSPDQLNLGGRRDHRLAHLLAQVEDAHDELQGRVHNLLGRAEAAERALADVRAERDHLRGVVRAQEAAVASTVQDASRAREQAAECMRETAQLHKALDSLGASPDKLARQVGAGEAVELFGRVYVARELLVRLAADPGPVAGHDDKQEGVLLEPGAYASTKLLEAQGGVFVPVPAGHMLSVTVTPYEDQPADE